VRFGIVTFPGSNCDYDAYHAVIDQLGEEATYLWHKDHDLQGADVVILPGGFSYGDYLRCGAIARFSPIMDEVAAHARRGGPVLGICNGFQIACEAQLLPGALLRNTSLRYACEFRHLVHDRAEAGDRAAAQVVAVAEAARQDHDVGALQVVILVPQVRRLLAELVDHGVVRVVVAVGPGEGDDAEPHSATTCSIS